MPYKKSSRTEETGLLNSLVSLRRGLSSSFYRFWVHWNHQGNVYRDACPPPLPHFRFWFNLKCDLDIRILKIFPRGSKVQPRLTTTVCSHYFSCIHVHTSHRGMSLKYRFEFSRSRVGLQSALITSSQVMQVPLVWRPHVEKQQTRDLSGPFVLLMLPFYDIAGLHAFKYHFIRAQTTESNNEGMFNIMMENEKKWRKISYDQK